MPAPVHGQAMGCTDTPPPENTSNSDLSRIKDILDLMDHCTVINKQAFWRSLPDNTRVDYNYSKWTYEAAPPR